MTAEQLEELARGVNPAIMGLDYDEVVTGLARRVICSEKLVDQLHEVAYACVSWDHPARAAYREAIK